MRPAILALVGVAGCGWVFPIDTPTESDGEVRIDAGDVVDGPTETRATACSQVDLLFMLDDSGSMIEEQANLGLALPDFMQVLQSYRTPSGAPLDYRIGVITPGRDLTYTIPLPPPLPPGPSMTELGEDGALRGGCDLSRRWIEPTDPDPTARFTCRAAVGTAGSPTEMPLYALKLATFDRIADGTNAGFLRPAAPLVMMVVTDEDDCSREDNNVTTSDLCAPAQLTPTTRYRDYFDQLKGGRDRWAMAIVAGPGPGMCTSKFGTAYDGIRLRQFRADTGDNVAFENICGGNLALGLSRLLEVVEQACAH